MKKRGIRILYNVAEYLKLVGKLFNRVLVMQVAEVNAKGMTSRKRRLVPWVCGGVY